MFNSSNDSGHRMKSLWKAAAKALLWGLTAFAPLTAWANFQVRGGTVTVANGAVVETVNVDLSSGALILNNSEVIVNSTWTRTNGNFTWGTSTVTFNNSDRNALVGMTTFYSLRAIVSGSTVYFTPGATTYVTNRLTFDDMYLRSLTNNATWYLRFSGTNQSIFGVNVRDSNALNGNVINASNSTNVANNRNWNFILVDQGERYWVGTSAGDWSNTANWSYASGATGGASVPTSTHTVIFDGAGGSNGTARMNLNVSVATLTISGYTGTINTNGSTFTVTTNFSQSSGMVALGTSAVIINGGFVRSGGSFSAGTSTITFSGSQNQTLTPGSTGFFNIRINKPGGTLTITESLDVNGSFMQSAGTFNTAQQAIDVAGHWLSTGGVFTDIGSTVTFSGTTVTSITGPATFYALQALAAGSTLQFSAGATYYVTNSLNLQDITLQSPTNGATWYLDFEGTNQTVIDVNVRDSNAMQGQTIRADESSNNISNNRNWALGDKRYWVASSAGFWNSTANWSLASGGTGGASLPTSTHTVIFDGYNGRNGAANINVAINIGTLTINGYTGALNTNGNTVTVVNTMSQNTGTIVIGTSVVTLQGDFTRTGGNFSTGVSTIQFTGTNAQVLTQGPTSFHHLVVNKTANGLTMVDNLDLLGILTVTDGDLDTGNNALTANRLNIAAAGVFNANNSTVTLNGTAVTLFSQAGTFNQGGSHFVMNPDAAVILTSGNITFYKLSLTPTLASAARAYTFGTSMVTILNDFTINPDAPAVRALTVTMSSTTVVGGTTYIMKTNQANSALTTGSNHALTSGNIYIAATSTLTANASTISLNGTAGTLLDVNGAFTQGTSTVAFTADANVTLTDGNITFNHVFIAPTLTGDHVYETGTGDWNINGLLNIRPDKTSGGDATLTVNMGGGITVAAANIVSIGATNNALAVLDTGLGSNYSLTTGRMEIRTRAQLNGRASPITITGTTAPLWSQAGTFDEGNSQVIFTGNATINPITSGFGNFYDLYFTPVLSGNRVYTLGSSSITVMHDMILNPSGTANSLTVNMGAPIIVGSTTTITRAVNQTAILTATAGNYRFTTGNLNIQTGGTFNATGSSVTLTGTTSPLITRTGTFTQGTSTVTVTSQADVTLTAGTITFVHLHINTPNQTISLGAATTLSGNLYVNEGTLQDNGFQIAGNTTNRLVLGAESRLVLGSAATATTFPTNYTAALTALNSYSTVTYASGQNQTISGVPTYGNLELYAPSGTPTKTQGAAVTVVRDFTIGANNTHDVSATNYQLNIGGNYTNNGTFNSRTTGTVVFTSTMTGRTLSGNLNGASDFINVTFNGTGGDWTINDPMLITATMTVTAGTVGGTSDVIVNGGVVGNGSNGFINMTGGTFEQRVAANQIFGSNAAGANAWTFNNLKFSNSSAAGRTIILSPTGTGNININGDLTFSDPADTFSTTVDANTVDRIIVPNGNVAIGLRGVFQASNIRELSVGGNWSNSGTYTNNNSTIIFNGSAQQTVFNNGQAFGTIISSNTHFDGLIFSSSFSAAQMRIRTSGLGSPTTMYFAAGSTFTVTNFSVQGTALYPVTLRSTATPSYWYLNNTSTHVVQYTEVEDSNASSGLRIMNHPGGVEIGHTVNWSFGAATPVSFQYTAVNLSSLTFSWAAVIPTPDSYTLQVSTNAAFTSPATSSTTLLTNSTTSGLMINTTYYARVTSLVSGVTSSFSLTLATSTLANPPASAASTWTAVAFSTISLNWLANNNPSGRTRYEVWLSSANDFSGAIFSSATYNLNATVSGLSNGTQYFARVKAINQSETHTAWVSLGSTVTLTPAVPTNFRYTTALSTALTAAWNAPSPAGSSYRFEVSTASDFTGTIGSSVTAILSATVPSLTANTTYYGRVLSRNDNIDGPWTVALETATLANIPATAVSTWTAVQFSSLTVNWLGNSNPSGQTLYTVEIASASNFIAEDFFSSSTYNLNATFEDISINTVYFGRVKAINHYGRETSYLTIGSTQTRAPTVCNAITSGNWSNPSIWLNCTGPGGLPSSGDAVTINTNVDVILNVDATIAGLTFATSVGANNSLTQLSTVTLTVNGPVTMVQPTNTPRTSSWNINASTASVSGLISLTGANAAGTRISQIVMTSGELNADNGITFQAAANGQKIINMSGGSGKLNLKGALTIPALGGTLTAGTAGSIFNYADDSISQTINFFPSGAYHNLHINNTSAVGAVLNAAVSGTNVTGNVRVQNGKLRNGGFNIVGNAARTFEVSNGAAFEMSWGSAFPTTFGTFTFGPTSRVRYLQTTGAVTITAQTYGHLDLMPSAAATYTFPAGAFNILGDLTMGNTSAATVTANTNSTTLNVGGALVINSAGSFTAHASNPLTVGGNWTNRGTFTTSNSTIQFNGSGTQTIQNMGKAFANIISSNTSAGGLIFASSFSATQLRINTNGLGAGATVYFAGGSTVAISTLAVNGTSSFPVVMRSTNSGTQWFLNNTSTGNVSYIAAQDSNASSGRRIFDSPGGVNLNNNVNWIFEINEPLSPNFTVVNISSFTVAWSAPSPVPDSYALETSTASDFTGTITSSSTLNLSAVPFGTLIPNTTYYARTRSLINGVASSWTSSISTLTLANVPATAISTWTAVNYTSFTVNWLANSNPTNQTLYTVEISTSNTFIAEEFYSSTTFRLDATFEDLSFNTIYFGRVKAINNDGIETSYRLIGSTQTDSPTLCNATGSGNWSDGTRWTGCSGPGGIPAPTDAITINTGIAITLNIDATVAAINFAAATTVNNTLTQLSTVTLTVNGAVTMIQPTNNGRVSSWNINDSTATVEGLISMTGANGAGTRRSQIVVTNGTLNANNGMSFAAAAVAQKQVILSGGAAKVNLKGNITAPANSATLTPGTASTFNYADDLTGQTINFFPSGSYYNLHINNTSGAGATLAAAVSATNVTGSLRVQSGLLRNGGFAIVGGAGDTFEVSNGATFEMSGTSAFPTTFTTFSFGPSSRVRYLQTSSPVTIAAQTFGHLDLMPAGTATHNFPAGAFTVAGDLSMGNGTNSTTVSANANNTTLSVGGNFVLNPNATYTAHASNVLNVSGDWNNNGTFTTNNSTVVFNGGSVQAVEQRGKTFAHIVSSNSSSGGLIFSSSYTASQLRVNAAGLGAGATIYFAADSTLTISTFSISGSASFPVVMRSTVPNTQWFLNNTGVNVVSYVQVKDSNASAGGRILNYPGGVSLGNNDNWAIGLNPPVSVEFTAVNDSSMSVNWSTASPTPDSYLFQVSPNGAFSPFTQISQSLVDATTSSLQLNTTYFVRVYSVINGINSSASSVISTATLANAPLTAVSTWTNIHYTSVTVNWISNNNPATTVYQVQLSTMNDFSSAVLSSNTLNTNAGFTSLIPGATYYGQVRAVNHSNIPTAWLDVGSVVLNTISAPSGLNITGSAHNTLTGAWNAPFPAGNSYTFQVSTASDFSGTIASSNTANLSATSPSTLSFNTTYYGRVNTVLNSASSTWSTSVTTATRANVPASAASTWTAVNITSITVAWSNNGNPLSVTAYQVRLSTVSNFLTGTTFLQSTNNLNDTFDQLDTDTTYYAQVRAINHYGIETSWVALGSTKTVLSAIPDNLRFTAAQPTNLTAAWDASVPPANTYTLRVSTDSDFTGTIVSSTTANLSATTASSLAPNTTYYGQVNATVSGITYPWSAYITTATLANIPVSAVSTWTAVNITSITVAWQNNSNPLTLTQYQTQLSTVSNFLSGTIHSANTTNLNADFTGLNPDSTYYARVRAINHYNVATNWQLLGSTLTRLPNAPDNLRFTGSATTNLSASWDAPLPAGNSYTLQVSTAPNFTGTVVSSITANLSATTASSLSVNTTYYGRVRSLVSGATSLWSISETTATRANVPATAASTWTAVFLTSFTVNWTGNSNPTNVTEYVVEISTASGFDGDILSSATYKLNASFESLDTATQYYGRVKAVNHSGIDTNYLTIGSTVTDTPTTCNAINTGNWSSPATWVNCTGPGGLPSATDIISISSVTVTLNMDATVGGIIFVASNFNSALTQTTNTMTVNGNVVFNQPSLNSRNNSWNITDGSATVTGNISFAGTNSAPSRVSRIVIEDGELNVEGNMTFAAINSNTKLINMSGGAGRINLGGNLSVPANSSTLLTGSGSSVFNYNGMSGIQTVEYFSIGAYENLYFNNTGAGVRLNTAITAANVTGDVRVQSGTFQNGGVAITGNSGKTFEVANGATFEMTNGSSFPSSFSTVSLGATSRVRYLQTSNPLTISAQTYGHLDLMPSATATQNFPAGAVSVLGDLTLGNTSAATISANANSTTLTVGGNLTINSIASFNANASNTLTVGGNWANNGTFTHNTSTVILNGSNTQTLSGSTTFYALRALTSGATYQFTAGTTNYAARMVDFENISLRSSSPGTRWSFKYSGSSQTLVNVDVQDSDASLGQLMQASSGIDRGNNINWDFGVPRFISVLSAARETAAGTLRLSWTATGDDDNSGTLNNSTFTVQYTTDTTFAQSGSWSPTSGQPSYVYRLNIATSGVSAGSTQTRSLTGLISGGTYYFRIWTRDDVGNTSEISSGATNYATPATYSIDMSTDTLDLPALIDLNTVVVISTPIVVTNTGNTDATFEFSATTDTVASPWGIAATQDIDRFVLWAVINPTEPLSGDFGNEDKLGQSNLRCTSSDITSGSSTCVSVPAGESRTIWFKLGMPTLTSTGDPQQIRITGTATPPDGGGP